MTKEQILELLKVLSKRFSIAFYFYDGKYTFETRLYPTDRYVNANHKTFEGAFEIFIARMIEHVSGKLLKEIEDIKK